MDGHKILLVEDDHTLREILSLNLQELGLTVFEAENGQSAQKQIQENKDIEIVLSDLNMPDMSGLDLITWTYEQQEKEKSPSFILMTGFLGDGDADKARELGVSHFLPKPFDQEFLVMNIETLLFGDREPAA